MGFSLAWRLETLLVFSCRLFSWPYVRRSVFISVCFQSADIHVRLICSYNESDQKPQSPFGLYLDVKRPSLAHKHTHTHEHAVGGRCSL